MSASSAREPSRPVGIHNHPIECLPADAPRDVNIRARSAAPLRVGGRSTIDCPDGLCALTVEEIYRLAGGRWNARCRVSDLVWL